MNKCKFCKRELDPVSEANCEECEACWYEMRLEPERFEKRMRRMHVRIADGGHGFAQLDDGSWVHFNRSPYRLASEPEPVTPTRAQVDEWEKTSRRPTRQT